MNQGVGQEAAHSAYQDGSTESHPLVGAISISLFGSMVVSIPDIPIKRARVRQGEMPPPSLKGKANGGRVKKGHDEHVGVENLLDLEKKNQDRKKKTKHLSMNKDDRKEITGKIEDLHLVCTVDENLTLWGEKEKKRKWQRCETMMMS